MTALPYQPVPTATQQRELSRWVSRHYPVSQYEQTQALISPVEAAGMACCDVELTEAGMSQSRLIAAWSVGLAVWGIYSVLSVLVIATFGVLGLFGSILGAFALVYAFAKIGGLA